VNLGYQTISFDAPSHGKLKGNESSLLEFIASIHELDKQHGPFEFAIGHSLGGMSLLNAIHDGMQVQKLVTIGAADIISDIITNFIKALTLKPVVATKMKAILDDLFGSDINEISASYSAKNVTNPTLVVHDENDADVEVSCAYSIHKALLNGNIHITKGLGHRRILGNQEVIEKIATFLIEE
ncbi:MAG: alpha/beta hydrolase, partial [Bacteroidota bacterium]